MSTEFLTNNLTTDWPFSEVGELTGIVVDLSIIYRNIDSLSLKISSFTWNTLTNYYTIEIVDSDSNIWFNGVASLVKPFGAFTVLQFQSEPTSSSSSNYLETFLAGPDVLVTVTIYPANLPTESGTISPEAAYLQESASIPAPTGVSDLRVLIYNNVLEGDIILQAGYNMVLSVNPPAPTDNPFGQTVISLNVVPGAGLGRTPGCTPPTGYLYSLNGVKPNAQGNLALNTDDCFTLTQPIIQETGADFDYIDRSIQLEPGQLQLSDDCKNCCSCEDYANTYSQLRSVWLVAKEAFDRLKVIRNLYLFLLAEYNTIVENQTQLLTSLQLYSRPGFTCAVQLKLFNHTGADLSGINLNFAFTGPSNGEVIPGSSMITYPVPQKQVLLPTGTWPTFNTNWSNTLACGTVTLIELEILIPKNTGVTNGQNITCTVSGSVGGQTINASYQTQLLKNLNKKTG